MALCRPVYGGRRDRHINLFLGAAFHLIEVYGKPGLLNRVIELNKTFIHAPPLINRIEDNRLAPILKLMLNPPLGLYVVELEAALAGFCDVAHIYQPCDHKEIM